MSNPDRNASGFLVEPPNPLRYTPPALVYDPSEGLGAIREIVPSGSRVLDVGCGTGWTAKELRDKKGCEVIGVEPNESRAEAARSLGIQVHVGYLEDLRNRRSRPLRCRPLRRRSRTSVRSAFHTLRCEEISPTGWLCGDLGPECCPLDGPA